jgi:hypothetical protein
MGMPHLGTLATMPFMWTVAFHGRRGKSRTQSLLEVT